MPRPRRRSAGRSGRSRGGSAALVPFCRDRLSRRGLAAPAALVAASVAPSVADRRRHRGRRRVRGGFPRRFLSRRRSALRHAYRQAEADRRSRGREWTGCARRGWERVMRSRARSASCAGGGKRRSMPAADEPKRRTRRQAPITRKDIRPERSLHSLTSSPPEHEYNAIDFDEKSLSRCILGGIHLFGGPRTDDTLPRLLRPGLNQGRHLSRSRRQWQVIAVGQLELRPYYSELYSLPGRNASGAMELWGTIQGMIPGSKNSSSCASRGGSLLGVRARSPAMIRPRTSMSLRRHRLAPKPPSGRPRTPSGRVAAGSRPSRRKKLHLELASNRCNCIT